MKKKIAIAINLDWPIKRYHLLFKGIQEYAKEYTDWTLVWDHYPEKVLKRCKDEPYYAGVIGRIKMDAYNEIQRLNIPVVNTWHSTFMKGMTSVFPDYTAAGEMAADHLLKKGYRNFVNIDYRASSSSLNFHTGFSKKIKPYNCQIKRYLFSHKSAHDAVLWDKFNNEFKEWIKDWEFPLAIYCSLSAIGPKITTWCLENDLRIPEDVAVISSGNETSYCEGFHPTISSIDIDYYKVGYESARQLHKKMEGKEVEPVTFISPTACIPRESTDSYAVQDKDIQIALRFISDNYYTNIQVIDVVESTNVSRSTLERKFTDIIGHSIFDEINRLRTASAKRLLIETDLPIQKISAESGFSSPHHFRRVFHKATGLKPSEYKKLNHRD